jgi:hypothetical protein
MDGFQLVAEQDEVLVLPVGSHSNVTIKSATLALSKEKTPQAKIRFENEDGVGITQYYNLKGYVKNEDGSFKRNAKGQRKEDPENTKKAQRIINKLACHAGIDVGTPYQLDDLLELSVGIEVISVPTPDGKAYNRVHYSFASNTVTEASTDEAW